MGEIAYKCLKMEQGIVVLVETEEVFPKGKKDVSLYMSDHCIALQVNFVHIVLLDDVVAHLISNPQVILFFTNVGRYTETSSIKVELNVQALLEAKGAWEYRKSLQEKGKSETASVPVTKD